MVFSPANYHIGTDKEKKKYKTQPNIVTIMEYYYFKFEHDNYLHGGLLREFNFEPWLRMYRIFSSWYVRTVFSKRLLYASHTQILTGRFF